MVGGGVGQPVMCGPGDADRAGDGEDLGEMAGSAAAAVFAVDDSADVMAAGFDEPVRADDDAEPLGVGLVGGETADEVGPVARGLIAVAPFVFDAHDLCGAGEIFKDLGSGNGAQIDAADPALLVSAVLTVLGGDFGCGGRRPVELFGRSEHLGLVGFNPEDVGSNRFTNVRPAPALRIMMPSFPPRSLSSCPFPSSIALPTWPPGNPAG